MGFGLERDVIVHFAPDGASAHIGRGAIGDGGFDVAAVAGQAVFAAKAEVAGVVDRAAGGNDLDQRSVDLIERDFAAERVDFDVAALHIGEGHGTVDGFHVNVGVIDVAD